MKKKVIIQLRILKMKDAKDRLKLIGGILVAEVGLVGSVILGRNYLRSRK